MNEFMGLTMSGFLMQFMNTISSELVYTMGMMGNLWIIIMIGVNCLVIFINTINECRHRRRLKSIKAANLKSATDLEHTIMTMRNVARKEMLDEMMENEGYVIDIHAMRKDTQNFSKVGGTD